MYSLALHINSLTVGYNLHSVRDVLSLDPRFKEEKLPLKENHFNGERNVRLSHRGGISLPGRTNIQITMRTFLIHVNRSTEQLQDCGLRRSTPFYHGDLEEDSPLKD